MPKSRRGHHDEPGIRLQTSYLPFSLFAQFDSQFRARSRQPLVLGVVLWTLKLVADRKPVSDTAMVEL